MRVSPHLRCSGATLIEVTVVIGVLALLFSLSLPAFQTALGAAKQIRCRGNLRQWGIATQLYAVNNNDYLPPDGAPNGRSIHSGWYISLPHELDLEPYSQAPWRTNPSLPLPRSIWFCPANSKRSNGRSLFHYCLNQHINGTGVRRQVKMASLSRTESLIWLFDNGKQAAVAQQNNVHTNLHRSGAQFLLLDGHVQHQTSRHYWDYEQDLGRLEGSLRWHP